MAEKTIWGIHAGSEGEADILFIKNKVIAIGWRRVGDLTQYKDREAYKNKLQETYKDMLAGAYPNTAGIFYRFVYEMKIGDLVIYPSKRSKQIYIGEVTSEYNYRPDSHEEFVHQRNVQWKANYPRTKFTQDALYEIGSALSLFQVKNYADEFMAALEGKHETKESGLAQEEEKEDVAGLTENFEQQAKDFVLKQLKKSYKGEALEVFIVHLLEKMGYHARQTPTNTPSVDIIAHKDEFGFENPIIKCQVKSEEGTINLDPVEKLCSRVKPPNEYGLFITLSNYNDKATRFGESQNNLRLINGYDLVDIILEHYDDLDTKYKNTIPLNKVFLPSVAK
jgi:restriction system protein